MSLPLQAIQSRCSKILSDLTDNACAYGIEVSSMPCGAKLMDAVKEYAREMNCIRLFVWPSPLARGWYERNGFLDEKPVLNWEE